VHEAALRREAGAYSSKPSTSSGPNQIAAWGVWCPVPSLATAPPPEAGLAQLGFYDHVGLIVRKRMRMLYCVQFANSPIAELNWSRIAIDRDRELLMKSCISAYCRVITTVINRTIIRSQGPGQGLGAKGAQQSRTFTPDLILSDHDFFGVKSQKK